MVTDFLKTKQTKEKLNAALEVLREFKGCESTEEWMMIPIAVWGKLEQLEEFLAHLTNGEPLKEDTIAYMKRRGDSKI